MQADYWSREKINMLFRKKQTRLFEDYHKQIVPKLASEFNLNNKMAVIKLVKVVVNLGIGDAKESKEEQEKISSELARITGQKPSVRPARIAVAGFGVRKGQPVGIAVTLRGRRMYGFLQKLFCVVLPRIRDFRGVSRNAVDALGNYTLGIGDSSVFPEIDITRAGKVRGMGITIVTTNHDKTQSLRLLEELGMPFEKNLS